MSTVSRGTKGDGIDAALAEALSSRECDALQAAFRRIGLQVAVAIRTAPHLATLSEAKRSKFVREAIECMLISMVESAHGLSDVDVIGGADAAATWIRVQAERRQRKDRQERRSAAIARDERTESSSERYLRAR